MVGAVRRLWWILLLVAACAGESSRSRVAWTPTPGPSQNSCADGPRVASPVGFRHTSTRIAAAIGEARHRSIDLVAADGEDQIIRGVLGYDGLDKEAEGEDVEVYACDRGAWRLLGRTTTDGEGRFALTLTVATRLPAGLHELALSVPADRSGAPFTAFIARAGMPIVVCDIDGTLTESENAIVGEIAWDASVDVKPGAARALDQLAALGYQPVYLTARPRAYAEMTDRWLAGHGLPRGPVINAPGLTLPGSAALTAKTRALTNLRAAGFVVAIGIGNRATDVQAYSDAGIPADRILIEATQYASEIQPLVARGRATSFTSYDALRRLVLARLPHA